MPSPLRSSDRTWHRTPANRKRPASSPIQHDSGVLGSSSGRSAATAADDQEDYSPSREGSAEGNSSEFEESVDEEPKRPVRKKARRICAEERTDEEDEEEDEEEPGVQGALPPKMSFEEFRSVQERLSASSTTSTSRLAILTIKTANKKTIKLALSEEILDQIPFYAQKLHTARSRTAKSRDRVQRLHISDDGGKRDEETLLRVFDWLATGLLPQDNNTADDDHPTAGSLLPLLSISAVATDLELPALADAAAERIVQRGDKLDIEAFLAFASVCYDRYEVVAESILGCWIKAFMAERLHVLIDGGWVERIKNGGGELGTQLMEVLVEEFRRGWEGKSRGDGKVAGETEKVEGVKDEEGGQGRAD